MTLVLSPELSAFLESGVSLSAASRNRRLLPSVSRVLACKVEAESGRIQLWLARSHSEQLLRDCLDCDRIALVASDPPTHRTWQIKGDNITQCELAETDAQRVRQHVHEFAKVITTLEFAPSFGYALYQHQPDELVSISFVPRELFEQTPGPRAGQKVEP